jgi:hypothetical protein
MGARELVAIGLGAVTAIGAGWWMFDFFVLHPMRQRIEWLEAHVHNMIHADLQRTLKAARERERTT